MLKYIYYVAYHYENGDGTCGVNAVEYDTQAPFNTAASIFAAAAIIAQSKGHTRAVLTNFQHLRTEVVAP